MEWLDVFARDVYRELILDSFRYCIAHKGLQQHAYVIMPNHIHLIASAMPGYELSAIVRDFKRHTSRSIIKAIDEPQESRRRWLLYIMELQKAFLPS